MDLKFRAWDKGHNKMSYKVNLYSMNRNGEIDKAQIDTKQTMSAIGFHCEIMQFIGIRDKKLTDIYQGDILKYEYYHPVHGKQVYKGVVEFDKGTASFAVEYLDSEFHYFGATVYQNACEVIGNIYETAEKLN